MQVMEKRQVAECLKKHHVPRKQAIVIRHAFCQLFPASNKYHDSTKLSRYFKEQWQVIDTACNHKKELKMDLFCIVQDTMTSKVQRMREAEGFVALANVVSQRLFAGDFYGSVVQKQPKPKMVKEACIVFSNTQLARTLYETFAQASLIFQTHNICKVIMGEISDKPIVFVVDANKVDASIKTLLQGKEDRVHVLQLYWEFEMPQEACYLRQFPFIDYELKTEMYAFTTVLNALWSHVIDL
jgi:hypothetical protein